MDDKKLIFVPLAFDLTKQSGVNISNKGDIFQIYIKNACNALVSAKKNNTEATVALVTNLKCENLPDYAIEILCRNDIKILHIQYDRFVFSAEYGWSLAFYKLCALSCLIESTEYEYFVWIDADVWVQGNFNAIWRECKHSLLLYDINHGLNNPNYKILCDEVKAFTYDEEYLTHYGGEFFAAKKEVALEFIEMAEKVYKKMISKMFITTKGDEFITSICAKFLKDKVKNAGAYICRYWTCGIRLVSTSYKFNKVLILHVPDEKEIGMLRLFDKYIMTNKMPSEREVWKLLGLSSPHKIRNIKVNIIKFFHKVKEMMLNA